MSQNDERGRVPVGLVKSALLRDEGRSATAGLPRSTAAACPSRRVLCQASERQSHLTRTVRGAIPARLALGTRRARQPIRC